MVEALIALGTELLDKNRVLIGNSLDLFRKPIPFNGLVVPDSLCAGLTPVAQAVGEFLGLIETRLSNFFDAVFRRHGLDRVNEIACCFFEISNQRVFDGQSVAQLAHIGAGNNSWDFLLYDEALVAIGKPVAKIEEEIHVLWIAHLIS